MVEVEISAAHPHIAALPRLPIRPSARLPGRGPLASKWMSQSVGPIQCAVTSTWHPGGLVRAPALRKALDTGYIYVCVKMT